MPYTTLPIDPAASFGQPMPPATASSAAPSSSRELTLCFTGSGREYFRIWIVNLMLTVLTLGLYSAWAKVRRMQYFDRNTELDGAVFDFAGRPMAILRGRVLAVAMLGAFQYAIGFSLAACIVASIALLAALPFLIRASLRFRLANTRYRGLAFGFTGSIFNAYFTYLPLAGLALAFLAGSRMPSLFLFAPLFILLWPLTHCVMKRYQHGNVSFACLPSRIDLPRRAFYRPYLNVAGIFIFAFGFVTFIRLAASVGSPNGDASGVSIILLPFTWCIMLACSAFASVRTTNLTWSATTFPGLQIRSTLSAWMFFELQVVNTLLTIFTLGLYRPFAVVRAYQYRLAHLHLTAGETFAQAIAADTSARQPGASGDGVADFFNLDVSW